MYKSAGYIKHKSHNFTHTCSHLIDEGSKIAAGFRKFKEDLLFVLKIRRKKINHKYV